MVYEIIEGSGIWIALSGTEFFIYYLGSLGSQSPLKSGFEGLAIAMSFGDDVLRCHTRHAKRSVRQLYIYFYDCSIL